jgi:hypothetical protein
MTRVSPEELRNQLESIALRVGIPVRYERLTPGPRGSGGLCTVRGQPRILVDAGAPLLDQIGTLERALRKVDLGAVFIPPFVRARIEGTKKRALVGPAVRKAKSDRG